MLPDYIAKATPRPAASRAPWYTNTAPTYAGVFLWIGFYQSIANGTLNRAGLGWSLAALGAAALLCFALYYYAPAMLGMKTGFPLYVVGSSTFGAKGGYLIPGLLMGALQAGWHSVSTDLSTKFILKAAGGTRRPERGRIFSSPRSGPIRWPGSRPKGFAMWGEWLYSPISSRW